MANEIPEAGVTTDWATSLNDYLQKGQGWVDVRAYGAVGTGIVDDTTAIQDAIDSLGSNGGFVYLPPGTYMAGKITLKEKIILLGASAQATCIKAKANLNDNLIESDGFASLTLTNKWYTADGVLQYIGLRDIRIDGNKTNQSSGNGIALYAKGIYIDHVVITSCKENGLYTEAGEATGVTNWDTMPEGSIDSLQITQCDNHGWHFRGPHDINVNKVTSSINGGDGLRIESSVGNYLANGDFQMMHCYSNAGYALFVKDSTFRAAFLRLEGSGKEGLRMEGSDYCVVGSAQLTTNAKTTGVYQVFLNSTCQYNVLNNFTVRQAGRIAAGGFGLEGDINTIQAHIRGDIQGGGYSTGVGLDIANGAAYNNIVTTIEDYNGVGGTALRTGYTAPTIYGKITAVLGNSTILWNNVAQGSNNNYTISGNTSAGSTPFTGVGPKTGSGREIWDVVLHDGSGNVELSEQSLTGVFDTNSTLRQIITLSHNLLAIPALNQIQISLGWGTDNSTWVVQYAQIKSADATQIIVHVKLSTASGLTQNGSVNAYVRI